MKITNEQIEEGRRLYSEFMRGMSGGFYTALFHAIASAKNENVYKLAAGFPGEVYAYREYIGGLDPHQWDIEGETTGEKLERILSKDKTPDFHHNGVPLSEGDLHQFNGLLEMILESIKDEKKK